MYRRSSTSQHVVLILQSLRASPSERSWQPRRHTRTSGETQYRIDHHESTYSGNNHYTQLRLPSTATGRMKTLLPRQSSLQLDVPSTSNLLRRTREPSHWLQRHAVFAAVCVVSSIQARSILLAPCFGLNPQAEHQSNNKHVARNL